MINIDEVVSRVQSVREEINRGGGKDVSLVAVTKTFGFDAMVAAHVAGCDAVGENYAQELISKVADSPSPLPVHFIGSLQSNKVKSLVPVVSVWQTVDKESVIKELSKRAPGAQILLQVNTTGEDSKGGVTPGGVEEMRNLAVSAGLHVLGLMTLGPTGGTRSETEQAFRLLRQLADDHQLQVCSMGMSDDFPIAVACGSTMVRVGSRLFGARSSVPQ